jgi:hypothetical protein
MPRSSGLAGFSFFFNFVSLCVAQIDAKSALSACLVWRATPPSNIGRLVTAFTMTLAID